MISVKLGIGENFLDLIKRFKSKCQKFNILNDVKRKKYYERPGIKNKNKTKQAIKKMNKYKSKWYIKKKIPTNILSPNPKVVNNGI